MNALVFVLLFQSFAMPPRTMLENPARISEVPRRLSKDYDKIWQRFLTGREDAKVTKDAQKLITKNPSLTPAIVVQAYVDLYGGSFDAAEAKFKQALVRKPDHPIALYYAAEIAFSRADYSAAADLYTRLLSLDPGRADLEMKRQKALLLATDNLLRTAALAEQEGRLSDAESLYLQALKIAPEGPAFHARLGSLYARQSKWSDALAQFQLEEALGGASQESQRQIAEALTNLGRTPDARAPEEAGHSVRRDEELEAKVRELEDLGRWGADIGRFHEMQGSQALKREELSALIVRYFPQVAEIHYSAQIVTDIQDSWASPDILTTIGVGILDPLPNHTFRPIAPITRGEFAHALSRLAGLVGVSPNTAPPISTTDLDAGNLFYRDVQLVLSYGLMAVDDSGKFDINGFVTGAQAIHAIGRLAQLARGKGALGH